MPEGPSEAAALAKPYGERGPDGARFAYGLAERGWLLVPLLVLLAGGAWWARSAAPFQERLAAFATPLAGRSSAQLANIRLALRALDGAWVPAGGRFSFNGVVGPRSVERGYQEAPAFMESGLSRSVGGGVCQVSSTLYAAVQSTRFPILERHPHGRLVSSVPPGRDAAVWFGQADLAFTNSSAAALRLKAWSDGKACHVELWGQGAKELGASVRLQTAPGARGARVVRVLRREGTQERQLSRDTYLP